MPAYLNLLFYNIWTFVSAAMMKYNTHAITRCLLTYDSSFMSLQMTARVDWH